MFLLNWAPSERRPGPGAAPPRLRLLRDRLQDAARQVRHPQVPAEPAALGERRPAQHGQLRPDAHRGREEPVLPTARRLQAGRDRRSVTPDFAHPRPGDQFNTLLKTDRETKQ